MGLKNSEGFWPILPFPVLPFQCLWPNPVPLPVLSLSQGLKVAAGDIPGQLQWQKTLRELLSAMGKLNKIKVVLIKLIIFLKRRVSLEKERKEKIPIFAPSRAKPRTPSQGTADTKKNQNIAFSRSCWTKPGSFALQSSPYLEAALSLLPSPCSTCEINVYFCAQLLPVPHVLPGKWRALFIPNGFIGASGSANQFPNEVLRYPRNQGWQTEICWLKLIARQDERQGRP